MAGKLLSAYPGGLLVVLMTDIFWINLHFILSLEHGSVKRYTGNYSQFSQKRAQQLMEEERHYKNAQREIQRMENMITQLRRWNREKSIRTAESKEKQLEKLKQSVQAPAASAATLGFSLKVAQNSGQDVLMAEHLSKAYNKPLFSDVNLHIRKGERVFLLGPNGCGKTTLFRILMKRVRPDNGLVQYGANVRPGYYDQTQSGLNPQSTALQEIQNAYPQMNDTQARSALASFLFRGDDVFKPISALSGGEKARIELLKLMLSESNFLLLDEPNHWTPNPASWKPLDYEGTLFAIPMTFGDRWYRILVFTEGLESIGNYDDYLRNAEQWVLASSPAKEKAHFPKQAAAQSSVQLRRAAEMQMKFPPWSKVSKKRKPCSASRRLLRIIKK
ncbi:MAG: ATP-binding cassette domain-containing protein [Christensenellales bacterium]